MDKSLQKFNDSVASNKTLRDNIDGLRRERVVFDSIYRKLETEFESKKKEMANIIEQVFFLLACEQVNKPKNKECSSFEAQKGLQKTEIQGGKKRSKKLWFERMMKNQANAAYEARDAAQAQMTSLKQQADKEHQEFEREWKELGRRSKTIRK